MSDRFGPAHSLGALVKCKLCGKDIVLRRHIQPGGDEGGLMPFDPELAPVGEWVPTMGTYYKHISRLSAQDRAQRSRFLVSHYGTCTVYLEQEAAKRAARLAATVPVDPVQQLGLF